MILDTLDKMLLDLKQINQSSINLQVNNLQVKINKLYIFLDIFHSELSNDLRNRHGDTELTTVNNQIGQMIKQIKKSGLSAKNDAPAQSNSDMVFLVQKNGNNRQRRIPENRNYNSAGVSVSIPTAGSAGSQQSQQRVDTISNAYQQSGLSSSINKAALADKLENLKFECQNYQRIWDGTYRILGSKHPKVVAIANKFIAKQKEIVETLKTAGYTDAIEAFKHTPDTDRYTGGGTKFICTPKLYVQITGIIMELREEDPTQLEIDGEISRQFQALDPLNKELDQLVDYDLDQAMEIGALSKNQRKLIHISGALLYEIRTGLRAIHEPSRYLQVRIKELDSLLDIYGSELNNECNTVSNQTVKNALMRVKNRMNTIMRLIQPNRNIESNI